MPVLLILCATQSSVATAQKHAITEQQIRKTLARMQVSHIKRLNEQFYLRSKQNQKENIILNTLNIKPLTNLIPKDKINNYLQ